MTNTIIPSERKNEIARRAAEGESLTVLGKEFGVTRERIRQVMHARYPDLDMSEVRLNRSIRIREERATKMSEFPEKIRTYAEENPDAGLLEIHRHFHRAFPYQMMREALGNEEVSRRLKYALALRFEENDYRKFTDEEIFADMRRVAKIIGEENPLAGHVFDKHSQTLSSVRVLQRFNTWREACAAAGVKSNLPVRNNYTRTYTDEQCREAVRLFIEAHPYGSYKEFGEWQKDRVGPSAQTIRNQLRMKWLESVAAAKAEVESS